MEPGHYAPAYSDYDRRFEAAQEDEYSNIRHALKSFPKALDFVEEHTDADHVLAQLLILWSEGQTSSMRKMLDGIVDSAARAKAEKRFL